MKQLLSNLVLKISTEESTKELFLGHHQDKRQSIKIIKSLVTKHSLLTRMIQMIQQPYLNSDDVDFVREQISKLPFFQQFFRDVEEQQILKICSQFKIETFQPLDVIMKQGDDSNDKMYVVVMGSVQVCVLVSEDSNQSDLSTNQNQKYAKRMSRLYSKYGRPVDIIVSGQGFGEIALLAKNKDDAKRQASIIALSEVDLIVLDKISYKSALQHTNEAESKEKFIQAYFPFIADLQSIQSKQYYYVNIVENYHQKGKIICQEGQTDDFVYILVKGSAQIMKNIKIKENDQEKTYAVRLLDLGVGEMIGDEILFNNDGPYEYGVRVSSVESLFYSISKYMINNRFPSYLIENFRFNHKLKQKLREQRIDIFLQEKQQQQKAELNKNITTQICIVNNKPLEGKMIPQILKQRTKMQLKLYDNIAIGQSEHHEFDQHQTERLFKEHMKHKKQRLIMTYQAHQLRGRELQQNTKDRYTQLMGIISSRTKTVDENYIDKLMGNESDLICNAHTNKFFTINNQGQNPPLYRSLIPDKLEPNEEYSMNQLDFGYMKDFDRQRKFKMIYLRGPKTEKDEDKRFLFGQLQKKMGRIYHKQDNNIKIYTDRSMESKDRSKDKGKESEYFKNNSPSNINASGLSINTSTDPYQIQEDLFKKQAERRKVLMRKTKNINRVNERIMKKYNSTEPSIINSE